MRVAEVDNNKNTHPILHDREITLAEVLKTRGYATGCFGKWDLDRHSQTKFRFIRRHKSQAFLVYLPHTMPHTRLGASDDFRGKSPRGLYGDVVDEIDSSVGRILDLLKEERLADNTYLLFTSDNGPWLIKNRGKTDGFRPKDHGGTAGPLRSGKVSTWEGGVRVPAVFWAPGRIEAGTVCDNLASTLDVLPTFAALAGADTPGDRVIDAENIRHLLAGRFSQADPEKNLLLFDYLPSGDSAGKVETAPPVPQKPAVAPLGESEPAHRARRSLRHAEANAVRPRIGPRRIHGRGSRPPRRRRAASETGRGRPHRHWRLQSYRPKPAVL